MKPVANVHRLPGASAASVGEPPEGMADAAKLKWREARQEWARVLSDKDRDALRLYCDAWAEMENAQKRVDEDGAMVLSPSGVVQKSPWLTKVEQNREFCRKMIAAFGGLPNARVKAIRPGNLGDIEL